MFPRFPSLVLPPPTRPLRCIDLLIFLLALCLLVPYSDIRLASCLPHALRTECKSLPDEGLALILESTSASIELLSVEGCVALTDAGLRGLSLCAGLRSLNLSSCTRITDAALRDLPLRCPKLAVLLLRRCPLVRALFLLGISQILV